MPRLTERSFIYRFQMRVLIHVRWSINIDRGQVNWGNVCPCDEETWHYHATSKYIQTSKDDQLLASFKISARSMFENINYYVCVKYSFFILIKQNFQRYIIYIGSVMYSSRKTTTI